MKSNLYFLDIFIVLIVFNAFQYAAEKEEDAITVPVGVVIDLNSPLGSTIHSCLELAVSDFYTLNPQYQTRLKLHTKDAQTLLDANLAVMELLRQEEVFRRQESSEIESLFAEIGSKHQLPIISFSSKNPPISYTDNNPNYLVRATPDDMIQARALASLCREFEWYEAAVLYEDTDHGNHFVSRLNKALREVEVRLAYMVSFSNADDDSSISRELDKLPSKQTRVFIVHTSPSLGSTLFRLAKRLGLMSEGYAWIITDSLSNFMNGFDSITRESMEGVLGIRPYVSTSSKEVKGFQERWRKHMLTKNNLSSSPAVMELNVYGLWAYDAATALAIAVEKTATDQNSTSVSNLGRTDLLSEVSRTKFEGLSGEFEISNGNLKVSAFEIFNVYGSGEKTIGFWSPERGRTLRDLRSFGKEQLGKVIWPGESMTRPKSSAVPISGVLRVGVPVKLGFTEFVKVTVDPATQRTDATGFSIDIFKSALGLTNLPIKYEFRYFNDTPNSTASYNNMLSRIPKEYDMAVGDITISAQRAEYLDFSQPYSEPGVVLVVKNNKPKGMWIFHKPLRWDLWLATFISFVTMGTVLLILERRPMNSDEGSAERRRMAYFAPVAVLAFPETNLVRNKWSLFVLVFWLFTAFILMQSYTANLAAMLTVDQLNFAFSDYYNIGYQGGSFMERFLTKNLHISKSRLKSYSSPEEYHEAMSLGSKKGGIDAIFDDVPYMKVFLKMYSPKYKMAGPTYRTGGFGFAFPKNSPLVSYFSKAILDVTQGPNMTYLERKYFGPGYSSLDPLSSVVTQETSSLRFYDFAGLFMIVGSVTALALFFSETSIGKSVMDKAVNFVNRYLLRLGDRHSRVHAASDQTNGDNSARENDGSDGNNGEGFELNVVEVRQQELGEDNADSAGVFRQ